MIGIDILKKMLFKTTNLQKNKYLILLEFIFIWLFFQNFIKTTKFEINLTERNLKMLFIFYCS